jgi:parvulin-like peptidyl-prolyl isomerase
MKRGLVLCLWLGLAALLLGTRLNAEVLVRVGDESIDDVEFNAKLQAEESKAKHKFSPQEQQALLESLVNQRLLVAHAKDEGLGKRDDVKRALDEGDRQILGNAVFQAEIASKAQVSEADCKSFYDAHPELFEARQVSQILVAPKSNEGLAGTKARADALFARLQADPKAFAKLARTQSDDLESAKKGGDLGFIKRNQALKPLAEAIFSASPGSLVGPVQTQYGFHLLLVKSKQTVSFADARNELSKELFEARSNALQTKLIDDLKTKFKVSYNKDK